MDARKLVEEQIEAIKKRLEKEANDLSVNDFISLHRQLESYIELLTRV